MKAYKAQKTEWNGYSIKKLVVDDIDLTWDAREPNIVRFRTGIIYIDNVTRFLGEITIDAILAARSFLCNKEIEYNWTEEKNGSLSISLPDGKLEYCPKRNVVFYIDNKCNARSIRVVNGKLDYENRDINELVILIAETVLILEAKPLTEDEQKQKLLQEFLQEESKAIREFENSPTGGLIWRELDEFTAETKHYSISYTRLRRDMKTHWYFTNSNAHDVAIEITKQDRSRMNRKIEEARLRYISKMNELRLKHENS